jgi:hypothetical protein
MGKGAEVMADEEVKGPVRKGNKGSFKPADERINREGRPRGSRVVQQDDPIVDRAPETDRLMLLILDRRDVIYRLTSQDAPWIINLPGDTQFVASRIDTSKDVVIFTIRSREFHQILQGTPIPPFKPYYEGLIYDRNERAPRRFWRIRR